MSAPYRRIIVLAMLSIDSQPSRLTSGCMNTWNTLGRISASSPVANAQKAWKPDRGGISGCRQYFPRAHTAQLSITGVAGAGSPTTALCESEEPGGPACCCEQLRGGVRRGMRVACAP
jgi:hypothetical protein